MKIFVAFHGDSTAEYLNVSDRSICQPVLEFKMGPLLISGVFHGLFDFDGRQCVDLLDIHLRQCFARPPIESGCGMVCGHDSPRIGINDELYCGMVIKQTLECFLALPKSLLRPLAVDGYFFEYSDSLFQLFIGGFSGHG